jgi:hypothetical protein
MEGKRDFYSMEFECSHTSSYSKNVLDDDFSDKLRLLHETREHYRRLIKESVRKRGDAKIAELSLRNIHFFDETLSEELGNRIEALYDSMENLWEAIDSLEELVSTNLPNLPKFDSLFWEKKPQEEREWSRDQEDYFQTELSDLLEEVRVLEELETQDQNIERLEQDLEERSHADNQNIYSIDDVDATIN